MTLWLVLALMTAAAIFAVLWPLGRRIPLSTGSDVAVYRDQLDEIERDRAAGRIGAPEADAARIEVSRRLLAAASTRAQAPSEGTWRRRLTAIAALVALPLGALALYLALGSPDLPGQPQSARLDAPADLPAEQRSIADLVGRVEAHLEANPDDGRGWEVIAPVYMRLGRYQDAVKARRNVLRLLGASAAREADLGEAMTAAANGIVTADAKAAFERALQQQAGETKARYFLGLAAEQDGRKDEAAKLWRALLDDGPIDAPWRPFVQESLARVDSGAAPRGPGAEDVAAAGELTPEQRSDMVRGMVARLAERLQREGGDLDGWLRLMRAYMVLGERDKARAAADDARRALASEPDKRRAIDDMVKGLGLEG